ncbi:EAL domain-containing protein [Pseudomonas sp. B21-040]|uniref:EAL domain-containing response regulator n=1 Tax=Pseudomonas sp. B21-040 TaxID=2895486 RepID=UPI00215FBA8F|nr:EAL domain-containing protein [Pseudomonas sp. B21-040]UVL43179.1 EAL domain-containing protein [Pseudomonas sp. B21-040]
MNHNEALSLNLGVGACSVLLVEDHAFQREYVAQQLRANVGVCVDCAANGLEALQLLKRKYYNLVVCDLAMPIMDGVIFIKRLCELKDKPHIIVLSAQSESIIQLVQKLAISLGIQYFCALTKPLVMAEFIEAMQAFDQQHNGIAAVECLRPTLNINSEEILEGLIRKQFAPWYQPQYDLDTGRIVGVEVLARWNHPVRGLLPPSIFMDTIIKSNWTHHLNSMLLDSALHAQSVWRKRGQDLTISFNIPVSLLAEESLPERLLNIVDDCGGDPTTLMLELTETTVTDHFSEYLAGAARLKLQGFKLSIDDYGTGYSSLLNLMSVPFDEIKLDRVFVHGAHKNLAAQAALESSMSLAHRLNMKVIAEGVEDPEDLNLLRRLGCHTAQGFLLGKPMTESALEELLFGFK